MPADRPIPETSISFNSETGMYGFSVRFAGKRPHHVMDTFTSLENALAWCDRHGERVWAEASDADEGRLLVSRSYKPGSVLDRMNRS